MMLIPTTLPRRLPKLALALGTCLLFPPIAAASSDETIQIQFLASTAVDNNGTAKARLREKSDSTDFQVELEKLNPGSYDLFVGGEQRGEIVVDGAGEGEIEFKTPQDGLKPLLDFDVVGQLIEVSFDGTIYFTDVFGSGGSGGGGGGGGGGNTSKTEVFMVNLGVDANAKGRLRLKAKPGSTSFDVNLENLDAGPCQLLVAGVEVAAFDPLNAHEVELAFRDPADDSSDEVGDDSLVLHLLLDFDPMGQTVDLVREGQVVLSGVLPAPSSQSGVKTNSSGKKAAKDLGGNKTDALRFQLQSTGTLFGANGSVTLTQICSHLDMTVTIDDVQDGTYLLLVDGVQRGMLDVLGGTGTLALSTEPGFSELLIDWPVKGADLVISLGIDPILQAVVPSSVQEALDQYIKEQHKDDKVRVNFYNSGEDLDARGDVSLKITSKHTRLKLQARDLRAGIYRLRADGLEVGSVTVDASGKAKFLFDTHATLGKGKALPLEFEAHGATLELVDDMGAVVLETLVD